MKTYIEQCAFWARHFYVEFDEARALKAQKVLSKSNLPETLWGIVFAAFIRIDEEFPGHKDTSFELACVVAAAVQEGKEQQFRLIGWTYFVIWIKKLADESAQKHWKDLETKFFHRASYVNELVERAFRSCDADNAAK